MSRHTFIDAARFCCPLRVFFACLCLAVLSGIPTAAQRPNVLLLCVDDLRPELGCYGKSYVHSPNIDALARRGYRFDRHYVQAPTCGASRYALLSGRYGPSGNGALFARAKKLQSDPQAVLPSMPDWFRNHGYTTVSVGKVSHHPGGRGGPDWDAEGSPEMPGAWTRHRMPSGPWQHPRGAMHGLANGEIRTDAGQMDVFQAAPGADSIYPDGLITEASLEELRQLSDEAEAEAKPFFLAVGIIRPHLPFGAPKKYLQPYRDASLPPIPHPHKPQGRTTWHRSAEFMKYNRWGKDPNEDPEFATAVRKHYAACVTYADAQVGRILDELDALGQRDNTIVVLWGDHGWHLGEHAIWGKHSLFEESLRSPLIIATPEASGAGGSSDAIVETIDVFATLADLAGLPQPDFIDGVSLRPQIHGNRPTDDVAISYAKGRTIRTSSDRTIVHRDGYVEFYDYRSGKGETVNVADEHPEIVAQRIAELKKRLRD
ncbi:sulfatase [Roseimaritima sediminicola]|uniref:sulfatase n=1 Tax=Roseimaritima sediminicola TaxID=2662066 RepID=UPI001298271A|nr:sulfatase [Roseimaritima sediminicola]